MKTHSQEINRRHFLFELCLATILFASFSIQLAAQASSAGTNLIDEISHDLEKVFKPNEPGAAVIALKDGQVVFRRGYGMANLELDVAIEPDMIFRIGSITKQFTAVAILMLMEQGKLLLSDEITRFLPDYPTHGHKITVEHLLTHTSGIKSYTSLPEWPALWRKDLKMSELIDLFKSTPLEFKPGDGWNYSNSGYILLGAIIEKVTGESYADFLFKNIFTPLGMKHSFYDSTTRVIHGRVAGYAKDASGYSNCEYLSMTQPHAAGALISTVDDLAKWDAALYTERLVKQESLKKAWTPFVMNNGKSTKYGYGWILKTLEGEPMITHSGGINGFSCDGVRLPESRIYVAVLSNRGERLGDLAKKIAARLAGKKREDPIAIKLPSFDKYIGSYRLSGGAEFVVSRDNDSLLVQHPQMGKDEIVPMNETEFFYKKDPASRVEFVSKDGAVVSIIIRHSLFPDDEAKLIPPKDL